MPRSNVVMLLSSYQHPLKNGFQATLPVKKIFKKSVYFEDVYPPPQKKDYIHKLVYHSPNTSNEKNKTKLSTKP